MVNLFEIMYFTWMTLYEKHLKIFQSNIQNLLLSGLDTNLHCSVSQIAYDYLHDFAL